MLSWALRTLFVVAIVGVVVSLLAEQDTGLPFGGRQAAVVDGDGSRRVIRGAEDDEEGWGRRIRIHADSSGHYMVEAEVNGVTVPFLVDTGASMVVLSNGAARRLGYGPNQLDYTMQARTANGIVRMAPVTLRQVRLDQLRVNNVEATVNEGPMSISLLGMTFLSRLRGYDVRNGVMTLHW